MCGSHTSLQNHSEIQTSGLSSGAGGSPPSLHPAPLAPLLSCQGGLTFCQKELLMSHVGILHEGHLSFWVSALLQVVHGEEERAACGKGAPHELLPLPRGFLKALPL
jgi:hypothetical protein